MPAPPAKAKAQKSYMRTRMEWLRAWPDKEGRNVLAEQSTATLPYQKIPSLALVLRVTVRLGNHHKVPRPPDLDLGMDRS